MLINWTQNISADSLNVKQYKSIFNDCTLTTSIILIVYLKNTTQLSVKDNEMYLLHI